MELHVTHNIVSATGIRPTRILCEHFNWSGQLRQYVKSRLDMGETDITCPKCGQVWAWQEVVSLHLLTKRDQIFYEKKLSQMTSSITDSYKKCPGCKSLLQRLDLTNLCMECPLCSETKGETFQFCWACLRNWKGGSPQGDSCANESCHIVAVLQCCEKIVNPALTVNGCPSIRACPQCKALVTHCGGCKYVRCGSCTNYFCFRCLDSFNACFKAQPNWYHRAKCDKPKAARQTFASESDASPLPIH